MSKSKSPHLVNKVAFCNTKITQSHYYIYAEAVTIYRNAVFRIYDNKGSELITVEVDRAWLKNISQFHKLTT